MRTHTSSGTRAIIVLSYAWIAREHPDPNAWHLSILAPLLQRFTKAYGRAAVFIDYCCMFQMPYANDYERDAFTSSLSCLKYLYAHQHTWVWCLKKLPQSVAVAYNDRGWPHFEQSISVWIKDRSKRLDLSLLTMAPTQVNDFYKDVERVCIAERPQLVTPSRFGEQLQHKVFTNNADHQMVVDLYERTFDQVMRNVRDLDFRGFQWTKLDVLVEALEFAQPPALRRLLLHGNTVSEEQKARLLKLLGPTGQLGFDDA